MKARLAIVFLICVASGSLLAQEPNLLPPPDPTTITLPAGTRILLAMRNSVTTRTGRSGDGVYLEATEPVAFSNHLVIPQGTNFQGTIAAVERAGKIKGRASLRLSIDRMIYRNGYVVEFNSVLKSSNGSPHQGREGNDGTIKAESSVLHDTLLTGAGALGGGLGGGATGAILGGVAGNGITGARVGAGAGMLIGVVSAILTRGQDVRLEQGTTVEIELQNPLDLELRRIPEGSPANYMPPQRPLPPPQPERARYGRPPALPFPRFPF